MLSAGTQVSVPHDFARPSRIPFPEEAPYSPQKAALGKMLFYDARLSGAQNLSCSSCHNPSFGWESPIPRAMGASKQPLDRHTPTIENLAESPHFFWDGRVDSFEHQALGPITHPDEMNSNIFEVVQRLQAITGYQRYFEIAFPSEGLTSDTILEALATYQRTLRSGWSPFDDWADGDEDALTPAAQRGFRLFTGPAQCSTCHSGWAFTDHQFHRTGIDSDDPGRGRLNPEQMHMFKTPGLRNIALRAPYMHNGSLMSLRDVLDHYRGRYVSGSVVASDVSPLAHLSDQDASDLIAFLESLTAYEPHITAPALPVD